MKAKTKALLREVAGRIDGEILTTDEDDLDFLVREPGIEQGRNEVREAFEALEDRIDRFVLAVAAGNDRQKLLSNLACALHKFTSAVSALEHQITTSNFFTNS